MLIAALVATLAAAAAAISAPAKVTSVTIFNDRARIVREASVELHGTERVELALLPDAVDPESVRVEVSGAKGEVKDVELIHIDTDLFPEADARKLLDQLDEADDRLALAVREHKLLRAQLDGIAGLAPVAPEPDLHGPAPKLNASGWAQVLNFLASSTERLQARLRQSHVHLEELERARQKLAEEAVALGATRRRSGLQVTARLAGEGPLRATLTYLIGNARWMPSWELTYRPADETVQAQLDGLVWQATGEEWTRAQLDLSTAVPGQVTALPELLSWRIGSKERFLPISHAQGNIHPMLPPLPQPRPEPRSAIPAEKDRLRSMLLERAQNPDLDEAEGELGDVTLEETGRGVGGGTVAGSLGGISAHSSMGMKKASAGAPMVGAAPPPPAKPGRKSEASKQQAARPMPRSFDASPVSAPGSRADSYSLAVHASAAPSANYIVDGVEVNESARAPTEQVGLGAPSAWAPPDFGADAPASLAGGFDLSFSAAQPATLESGSSARRIPLFAESWPVHTERLLYPALAPDAWLVAKLIIPAQRTLPGGEAQLFVGADPTGHARLQAMAPGEEISLPLGIDRAVKSVRNVSQVQSEHGVFTKDDVDEYVVTIEIANPYPRPTALRVVDQIPRAANQFVEVEFLQATPAATPDAVTGKLEWAFAAAPSQKTTLTFSYRLRRPHGARLSQ